MEPTGGRHGEVVAQVAWLLKDYVRRMGAGGRVFGAETGFRLARDPDTVLAPDAAFVAAGRLPPGDAPDRFPELAPDLVAEILSPGDTLSRMNEKATMWIHLGARMVWIVDPRSRTITVREPAGEPRTLSEPDLFEAEPVLPGFGCHVKVFFES